MPESKPVSPADAPEKSLLRMSAPLILSFWMRQIFTFVDTIYASYLEHPDASIAAIGLTIPLEFVYIATWVGLSTALTSHLAKAMGRGDNERFDRLVDAVRRALFVLIPTFLLGALGLVLVIPELGLDPAVAERFRIYGPVLFGGQAAIGFWSILPDSIVKAHHDTRATMMAGICSNLLNVALNTLFTFVFHWGMFGLAFSTVLGNLGGLAYALRRSAVLERGRRQAEAPQPAALEPPLQRPLRLLLKLAAPSATTYGLMASEGFLVNWLLSSVPDSTAALAAYSIYYRVTMFAIGPVIATTIALLPFVARYLGQGRVGLVRSSYLQALGLGAAYSAVVLGPACWLGAGPILRWLAKDPATVGYGLFALRLIPLAVLVSIPFLLSRPVFEGSQQGRPSMVMAVLRYALLAPPLGLCGMFVAERLGAQPFHGLMLGLVLATALCSGAFLAWVLRYLRSLEPVQRPPVGRTAESLAGT
jgi:Na+-driven multidrug efflux pump